jgi:hypothetical protein
MWNDRPATRPVIGETNAIEEMDVRLSLSEYRQFLADVEQEHRDKLLGGSYVLEPWVRVRMADDWFLTAGIEVSPDEDAA